MAINSNLYTSDARRRKIINITVNAVIFTTALALLIIASFYDLQISHALSNGTSVFGRLFVSLAEVPAYSVLPISGVILLNANHKFKSIKWTWAARIASLCLIYIGFFAWGVMGSRVAEFPNVYALSALYSILLSVLSVVIGRNLKVNYDKYIKFAIFAIIVMLVSLIVIRVMKLTWGRMRYRDMLAIGDFSGFTPWYLPQGATGATSFPSGHSASAANIFIFAVLFKGKARYIANAVGIIFVILSCFSRIVINAHFMSDVIVGSCISYLCYYLTLKIMTAKRDIVCSDTADTAAEIGVDNEKTQL